MRGFDQNALKTTVSETLGLTLKKNGDPHPNVHNIFEVLSNSASWYSVFAFDEFADRNKVIGTPPYAPANDQFCIPRDLRDEDYSQTQAWLNKNGFPTVGDKPVDRAVNLLCRKAVLSPVRHYLESLSFDPDNDQLSAASWMQDYLGVEPATDAEREYVQAVALKSLGSGLID